jgi:nucleoside-diphosphate-sugar epimerase
MGTVLVTGGGFLGKHQARALVDAGEKVVIAYHRTFPVPQLLADVMQWYRNSFL